MNFRLNEYRIVNLMVQSVCSQMEAKKCQVVFNVNADGSVDSDDNNNKISHSKMADITGINWEHCFKVGRWSFLVSCEAFSSGKMLHIYEKTSIMSLAHGYFHKCD